METKTVYLKDFAVNLGPRYKVVNNLHTQHSGELYREEHLIPMLKDTSVKKIILDINGTRGSASFWEEAFGGAVRKGFTPDVINTKIQIESNDKELLGDIQRYMKDAESFRKK